MYICIYIHKCFREYLYMQLKLKKLTTFVAYLCKNRILSEKLRRYYRKDTRECFNKNEQQVKPSRKINWYLVQKKKIFNGLVA